MPVLIMAQHLQRKIHLSKKDQFQFETGLFMFISFKNWEKDIYFLFFEYGYAIFLLIYFVLLKAIYVI